MSKSGARIANSLGNRTKSIAMPENCGVNCQGQGGSLEVPIRTQPRVHAGRSLVVWNSNMSCANRDNTRYEFAGPTHTRNGRG
jgi:hypothetical protein